MATGKSLAGSQDPGDVSRQVRTSDAVRVARARVSRQARRVRWAPVSRGRFGLPARRRESARVVLPLLAAIAACGGGTYEGETYADDEARYRLSDPEGGWSRVEVDGQNDLAWAHASLGAVIQANASCNPSLDIPLVSLTNHLLIGFTERETLSEELVELAAREALRTHVRAKLDGVPRELLLVVLKKDGCVYDFALVAPPASFGRAQPTYDGMLRTFETR